MVAFTHEKDSYTGKRLGVMEARRCANRARDLKEGKIGSFLADETYDGDITGDIWAIEYAEKHKSPFVAEYKETSKRCIESRLMKLWLDTSHIQ